MTRRTRSRASRTLSVACLLGALASACTHAKANVAPMEPLDTPNPPRRVVEAIAPEAPPLVGTPDSPPAAIDGLNRVEPARPPRPTPPRTDAARPADSSKTDAASAEPVKPPEDPRTQVPSPLQSTPTQREGEVEAGIRADLRRATDNLNRVDYRLLSADAKDQYNGAKTLIRIADEALRARNLVFAKSLAEKAVALASQLAGR
jgi:hypothetical protein